MSKAGKDERGEDSRKKRGKGSSSNRNSSANRSSQNSKSKKDQAVKEKAPRTPAAVGASAGRKSSSGKDSGSKAVHLVSDEKVNEMGREQKVGAVAVVGGGIAGIQSALDMAGSGFKVYLVESLPNVGGVMAKLDKTFPTNDCSSCMMGPKLSELARHRNIEIITLAGIEKLEGEPGNFTLTIKRRPRFVSEEKCTGCGECAALTINEEHPVRNVNGEQWVDRIAIDEVKCIQCGRCAEACIEENRTVQGMTNIARQRFKAVDEAESGVSPSILQGLLAMSVSESENFWREHFQKCIKCYGCVDVCPVQVGPSAELALSKWVPAGEIPPSFPLFHLMRAYQVWGTCVRCGECERTCPARIPLKTLHDLTEFLPPEKVFDLIPGLKGEAKREIIAIVEKRRGLSRRSGYAV